MGSPTDHDQIDQAPTPQNTPASVSGSYLNKTRPPAIPTTIKEDEELRHKLLTDPGLLSAIEGKLSNLIGQDSGYFATLPSDVQSRVYGLKSLQEDQRKLEEEFQAELLDLERKFHDKYAPLYLKRQMVITGETEPTKQQIEAGKEAMKTETGEDEENEEKEDGEKKENKGSEKAEEEAEAKGTTKGIPGFWLTALENLNPISDIITDRDADILDSLEDVRMNYLKEPGFELTFQFASNDYFTNKTLTKSYYYKKELGYSGDFIYDHANGCKISWKDNEHNVTMEVERRKQRNKHTKQVRTIEKLTPIDSFFNFFDPPIPPNMESPEKDDKEEESEDANEEEEGELERELQMDYEVGELIKDKLIPRAVDWFTGRAIDYEYEEGEEEEGEEEEEEDGAEEDAEEQGDGQEEGEEGKDAKAPAAKAQPPECKEQ